MSDAILALGIVLGTAMLGAGLTIGFLMLLGRWEHRRNHRRDNR